MLRDYSSRLLIEKQGLVSQEELQLLDASASLEPRWQGFQMIYAFTAAAVIHHPLFIGSLTCACCILLQFLRTSGLSDSQDAGPCL